jgi:hypothetical protein
VLNVFSLLKGQKMTGLTGSGMKCVPISTAEAEPEKKALPLRRRRFVGKPQFRRRRRFVGLPRRRRRRVTSCPAVTDFFIFFFYYYIFVLSFLFLLLLRDFAYTELLVPE